MGCLKCCVFAVPFVALLGPIGLSLLLNGWVNDYFPPPGWSIDQMPDLTGKVAVVTGPTIKGIGYESCVEMAKKGAHVILAGRSKAKGDAAVAALKERVPAAKADFMILDLGSLQSVKDFATEYLKRDLPLHILLNNAGVMANPFTLTADGIESQFGTNHIGHFLLTNLLLPALEKSAPSRVISVSSAAAFIPEGFFPIAPMGTGVNFTDIYAESESRYEPWAAYGRSKLANVLFASGLDKRLKGKRIYSNSCHPGGIVTNLDRHLRSDMSEMIQNLMSHFQNAVSMTPTQGAVTQLYLATAPEIEEKEIRGKYYYPQARLVEPPKLASEANQEELWSFSEKLVAKYS